MNPNTVLDTLIERLHLKNDAALARALGVAAPVLSKLRHGRHPIGPAFILRALKATDLTYRELEAMLGVQFEGEGA